MVENFCHCALYVAGASVSFLVGHARLTFACAAVAYCRTRTCLQAHFGKHSD
jgi:hypothetical protein